MRRFRSTIFILVAAAGMTASLTSEWWNGHIPRWVTRLHWWMHPTDRILHFSLYFLSTLLLISAVCSIFPPGSSGRRRWIMVLPIVLLLIGTWDEITQSQRRSSDLMDWLCNLAGILAAMGILWWREGRWRQAAVDPLEAPADTPWTIKRSAGFIARLQAACLAHRQNSTAGRDAAVMRILAELPVEDLARIFLWSRQPELALSAWRELSGAQADSMPAQKWAERYAQVRELCRAEIQLQQSLDLRREPALAQLLEKWAAAGVITAPFKGPFLSVWLGQPPGTRPAGDLDFCLLPADLPAANAVLEAEGAYPATTDPLALAYMQTVAHDTPWTHPTLGMIELHPRLYSDLPPNTLEIIWRRGRTAQYLGHPIRAFNANDLYVLLSLHLFLHGWTGGGTKWITDLLHFHLTLEVQVQAAQTSAAMAVVPDLTVSGVSAAATEFQAAFPVLATQAILGHLLRRPLPAAAQAGLRESLTASERKALAWIESPAGLDQSTDWMVLESRRRHPRSAAGQADASWKSTLVPHPGRIALELGIRSDDPGFPRQKRAWLLRRFGRALAAVLGFSTSARPSPNTMIAAPAVSVAVASAKPGVGVG